MLAREQVLVSEAIKVEDRQLRPICHVKLARLPHGPVVLTCELQTFGSMTFVSLFVVWHFVSSCREHNLRPSHIASHRPVRKRSTPVRCNTCSVHLLVLFVPMATSPSKIPRLRRPKASRPSVTVKTHGHVLTNNNSNTSHINGPGTINNNNSVTNHIDARPPAPRAPLVRLKTQLCVVIFLIVLQRCQHLRDAATETSCIPWSRQMGR